MVNNGFYRGIVISNVDTENAGRCKIHIPGVYDGEFITLPDRLPWAEPVMPIFGGAGISENSGVKFSSTGWTSVPGNGTYVWVFFEGNDQNYPKYFASAQAGDAWMSEHEMQHVLSSENFRITIDENPDNSESSMQTSTENPQGTKLNNQGTRARIEIEADQMALDVVIKGHVNLTIDGDLYQKITGDRHTYVQGDDYLNVDGNTSEIHKGDKDSTRDGSSTEKIKKNRKVTVLKNDDLQVSQEHTTFVGGNNNLTTGGSNTQTAGGINDHK